MRTIFVIIFLILSFALRCQDGNSYYYVSLNTNPDREELSEKKVEELQAAHLANIERLWKERKLPVAGPFYHGGGLFIFRASSQEEVEELLQSDPAIAAGRFLLEIRPWTQLIGSICEIGEEYEMADYEFFHFTLKEERRRPGDEDLSKAARDTFQNSFKTEEDVNVVALAFLGSPDEAVLIIQGDEKKAEKLVSEHPYVSSCYWASTHKKLWIADGLFCK
jgi:uncharacterized protein YciI